MFVPCSTTSQLLELCHLLRESLVANTTQTLQPAESGSTAGETMGDTGDPGGCDALCWNRLLQFWIEGVAVPVIAGLGIIGNIFCLFVLNHKCVDLKASFSNLLKCLCVFDILILVRNR